MLISRRYREYPAGCISFLVSLCYCKFILDLVVVLYYLLCGIQHNGYFQQSIALRGQRTDSQKYRILPSPWCP